MRRRKEGEPMKIGGLSGSAGGGGGRSRHDHLRELQLLLQDWADYLNW